jgi:PilZ domain
MAEFILNPRRAPRAPVRCDARIALKEGGFFSSPTSDYGPQGCQLRTPVPLAPGSRIFVELVNERLGRPVELAGRVAWASKAPPWRMGVSFDAGSLGAASGFFEALAAAYPGIDTYGRAPDRIPEDAPLAPAPPPDVVPLLTDDEANVLRAIGPGLRADALRAKLGPAFEHALNAVFALIGRRYLAIGEPDPAAAAGWARLLAGQD